MSKFIVRTSTDMSNFANVPFHSDANLNCWTLRLALGEPMHVPFGEDALAYVYCIELYSRDGDAYMVQMISYVMGEWSIYATPESYSALRAWGSQHNLKFKAKSKKAA